MIRSIRLQNFRGFEDHRIPFAPLTIVVGANNAGKTSIVEALRLLSMVTLRLKGLGVHPPPKEIDLPKRLYGVSPSLKNVEINMDTIFHRYQRESPAIITAEFGNGASVTLYVFAEHGLHAVIRTPDGSIAQNKDQALQAQLPAIRIMPQVAPLQREESILSEDYVTGAMASRLAPLHFRNQLKVRYDLFPRFKEKAEGTWPGVQIRELIGLDGLPGEPLYLEVRNEDFVAEVAEMGHGLQMWLQTMWFLTLAEETPTVILDEPDVYLHADLQRRVVRLLRTRHQQTIITTHSVEIMSEVQPEEILVVDKRLPESRFADSVPAVQSAVQRCGSVHNIHLARLLSANRMLLVEGKDIKILKEIQDKLFPESETPLQSLPNMSIGGWTGWKVAIGSSMSFRNILGEGIQCFCILDSDYHTPEEIDRRYAEAAQRGISLHIWLWKEIENYLLCPSTISRYIASRCARRIRPPGVDEVRDKLMSISDRLEDDILDAMATEYWSQNRAGGQKGANRAARARIRDLRNTSGSIIAAASGKELLSALSEWSNTEFGVPLSAAALARAMTPEEIPSELSAVLACVDRGDVFPGRPIR